MQDDTTSNFIIEEFTLPNGEKARIEIDPKVIHEMHMMGELDLNQMINICRLVGRIQYKKDHDIPLDDVEKEFCNNHEIHDLEDKE